MDPRIRIRINTKMSWISNTAFNGFKLNLPNALNNLPKVKTIKKNLSSCQIDSYVPKSKLRSADSDSYQTSRTRNTDRDRMTSYGTWLKSELRNSSGSFSWSVSPETLLSVSRRVRSAITLSARTNSRRRSGFTMSSRKTRCTSPYCNTGQC